MLLRLEIANASVRVQLWCNRAEYREQALDRNYEFSIHFPLTTESTRSDVILLNQNIRWLSACIERRRNIEVTD